MDVDSLVETFIQEREQGIATLHRIYFKGGDQLSLRALKESLVEELRTGCVTFINKGAAMEELNDYLFYIVNAFCKKSAQPIVKRVTEYICPGCVYLGKEYSTIDINKVFKCDECASELKISKDPKSIHFFRTFAQHSKVGYHCSDCQRFIPHPLDNSIVTVSCPYFDCSFVGLIGGLHKMHHPTSKSNPEKLILDGDDGTHKVFPLSKEVNAQIQLEIEEDLQNKFDLLQEIIESQSSNVSYCSSDATIRHKQYVYQAFSSLLEENPTEMVAYLLNTNDNHCGFQHKVFQRYIKLLEASLPFVISKRKKFHKVETLLDETLCLFDGISVYNSKVTNTFNIKNETKEFYIGGRKAAYTKPYYIGKLLNVIHGETKVSLMSHVRDYSFSRIHLRDIDPGTPVTVTHLRVPPHYQMGGMAYVNRIRKKIVERARAAAQS
jgi:hypothetical protein